MNDNSGPAFPMPSESHPQDGMSLRDYAAIKALPAVITACTGDTRMPGESQPDYFARICYELADAMLKARTAAPAAAPAGEG